MRINVLVYEGFDEMDALGPWELLRVTADLEPSLEVRLVAFREPRTVRASHGLLLHCEGTLDETSPPDWLLVPGGNWASRAPAGTWAEAQRGAIPAALDRLYARGTKLATVCTGAMLVAAAGLARGRTMTTHAVARTALAEAGAIVSRARVVDDGDLVSAGGVTSGLDLARWLVERLVSPEVAARVAERMELLPSPPVELGPRSTSSVARSKVRVDVPVGAYAVIFTSQRRPGDDGYGETADAMEKLASTQPGYLGLESARSANGAGITVSYWKDHDAVLGWKKHAEHRTAQEAGRVRYYDEYAVRVCRVERAYSFERPQGRSE